MFNSLKGKKLLLIGATAYFIDVVKAARDMGVHTIMIDYNPNAIAKPYADESYTVDTIDKEGVLAFAKEKNIDGVFVGWSDINLYTAQYVCEKLGLPFYAGKEQLDISVNKNQFKEMCRNAGVMTTKEYFIDESFKKEDLAKIVYPVIVKPVDNGGTRGISVCSCDEELMAAYKKALDFSYCKKVIVEEFLENDGKTVSVKYLLRDGEAKLLCIGDRYVLDPKKGKAMITNVAFYPSLLTERYIKEQDNGVKAMFKKNGFKNGQLFMEGIPTKEGIKFYEMGYRLSGGITYKITTRLIGLSGMRMLIRFALTGKMCDEEEYSRVDPMLGGKCACSFAVLLKQGKIARLNGMDEVKKMPQVVDVTQYYKDGDSILEKAMGNVGQMLARITVDAPSKQALIEAVEEIEDTLVIEDENGNNMLASRFDKKRILELN